MNGFYNIYSYSTLVLIVHTFGECILRHYLVRPWVKMGASVGRKECQERLFHLLGVFLMDMNMVDLEIFKAASRSGFPEQE